MPDTLPLDILGGVPTWNATFTSWVPFASRHTLRDPWDRHSALGYPGVYLLAHFPDGPPSGPADYLSDAIVYVGKSKHLGRRLNQFLGSTHERRGHSGGHSYRRKFDSPARDDLYVSVLPVWFGDNDQKSTQPLTSFFVGWAESHVICRLAAARAGADAGLLNKP